VLDTKTAYGTPTPKSPGNCRGSALVQLVRKVDDKTVYGDLVEMHIYAKWYEGKRTRYNLVQFGPDNTPLRSLAGWNGEYVQEL